MIKHLASLTLLAAMVCQPNVGWAQQPSAADRSTARRLGSEGVNALKSGDFDTAADRFERANELVSAPSFLVLLARARVGQGRLVEAYEIYRTIIRQGVQPDMPEAFKRALADAKQEIKGVEPRLGWLTINVVGIRADQVEVTLNGSVIPSAAIGAQRPVDPGTLSIQAKAEGYETVDTEVRLAEGQHLPPIELQMAELPKPEPSALVVTQGQPIMSADGGEPGLITQSTLGYLALGLGGAGLAVGSVTGIIALNRHSELESTSCDWTRGNECWVRDETGELGSDAEAKEADLKTFADAATVSFIAGGALAATGLILLFTAPDTSSEAATRGAIRPYAGFGSIGAVGTF